MRTLLLYTVADKQRRVFHTREVGDDCLIRSISEWEVSIIYVFMESILGNFILSQLQQLAIPGRLLVFFWEMEMVAISKC